MTGVAVLTAAALGVLTAAPTAAGAGRLATRLAAAATTLSRQAPAAPLTLHPARSFRGTPAVGALFAATPDRLGRHFCTGTVVDSPVGDLVITAAHCVSRMTPGSIVFAPGYHDGLRPYGVWTATQVVVDKAWRRSADPGHDVAFLIVHRAGESQPIQRLTGGEQLGVGWPAQVRVHVIGYPDTSERPVVCQRRTHPFGKRQLVFRCGGYTNGTSGGPFLALDPATGEGTVIGVIGGYQQGGDVASISYSPRFGRAVRLLYKAAVARG